MWVTFCIRSVLHCKRLLKSRTTVVTFIHLLQFNPFTTQPLFITDMVQVEFVGEILQQSQFIWFLSLLLNTNQLTSVWLNSRYFVADQLQPGSPELAANLWNINYFQIIIKKTFLKTVVSKNCSTYTSLTSWPETFTSSRNRNFFHFLLAPEINFPFSRAKKNWIMRQSGWIQHSFWFSPAIQSMEYGMIWFHGHSAFCSWKELQQACSCTPELTCRFPKMFVQAWKLCN